MIELKKILKKINLEAIERILSLKVLNIELSVLIVTIAIGIYALIFSYFTIMKNYGFGTYAWDLGIFNQAFWTTSNNGKFFFYTGELLINPSGSFFGIHFSPIVFFILPFYTVYPAPQTLLVIQSFVLALGAVPLYKIAKNVVNYRVVGVVFVMTYLLYPPLQGINWFDFHVQSFLPLFFFSAIYFFEKQNWKTYFLFITLSLMVEEHVSMVVMFIGLFGLLQHKNQLASILKTKNFRDPVFLTSVATTILAVLWYPMTLWVRDSFFPINPSFVHEFKAAENWSVLGVPDPIMAPLYLFLYPARAIAALSYDFLTKIGYLLILFGPLALKPFSSIKHVLPAAPWLLLALFSNYLPYYGIFNQYPAYVIAFIFIAAVYAIGKGENNLKTLRKPLATIFLCSLVAFMLVSPIGPVVNIVFPSYGLKPITEHEEFIHEVLTYVPTNASIMTQNNIFPHVSSRINAYVIPVIHHLWSEKASEFRDFTNETLKDIDYVLVDFQSEPPAGALIFSLMQENHGFKVFVSAGSIILFKKDFDGQAKILAPYNVTYNYRNLNFYSGELVEDPNSTSGIVMHFNGSFGSSIMFWYGPRSILPPGGYNITLKVKQNSTEIVANEIFVLEFCTNNGQNILTSKTLFDDDFAAEDTWVNQTLYLNLDKPLIDFEIRAINVSSHVDLYLDYIEVKQIDIP